MAAAKEKGALEKTPEFFAGELDEHYDFDAIVMPSILLHKTRAHRRRRLVGRGEPADAGRERAQAADRPRADTLAEGIALGGISGDVLVTSVHVMVFSREGERVFEGRGGIDFIHEVDMSPLKKKRGCRVPHATT